MEKLFADAPVGYDVFLKHEDEQCATVPAMVFAEMQPIGEIYPLCEALENGTVFKNLDKPFLGRNGIC